MAAIWLDHYVLNILGPFTTCRRRGMPGCRCLKTIPTGHSQFDSERLVSRLSLEELIAPEGGLTKDERNEIMRKAHLEWGYSFTAIGKHVGLHYAAVSRIVRGE